MSEQKHSTHEPKQRANKEPADNSIQRMAGKTEKAVMKKGQRKAIVDTKDKSHAPYFYTLIDGENQWQLVHKDRYTLEKRTGKIGNIPMSSLKIK